MEVTLNARGEGNTVRGKCCFVITSLGSGIVKSATKLGQRPFPVGLEARCKAPGVTGEGACSLGAVDLPFCCTQLWESLVSKWDRGGNDRDTNFCLMHKNGKALCGEP